jgi:hypothetical protein
MGVMKQRFARTLGALATVLCVSASVAVAAPGANRGLADEVRSAKPDKPAKPAKTANHDRGRHLGQVGHEEQPQEEPDGQNGRPQNHGWFVSQVAKDHSLTGREHGKAVSEVARSNQGKPEKP